MLDFTNDVRRHVNAGFPCLWVATEEAKRAATEIAALAEKEKWGCGSWNVYAGLTTSIETPIPVPKQVDGVLKSMEWLREVAVAARRFEETAGKEGQSPVGWTPCDRYVLVLENFHKVLSGNFIMVQALCDLAASVRSLGACFVILAPPSVQIPAELERAVSLMIHRLPDSKALTEALDAVEIPEGYPVPNPAERTILTDAAAGLAQREAENAYSLSLQTHGAMKPDVVWGLKAESLRKGGLLQLHMGNEKFSDVGGLNGIKEFCLRGLRSKRRGLRGVLLLGHPGVGKSFVAKALGNEVGRRTVLMDLSKLFAGLVGQSEGNVRSAVQQAESMGKIVLFIDWKSVAPAGNGKVKSSLIARNTLRVNLQRNAA